MTVKNKAVSNQNKLNWQFLIQRSMRKNTSVQKHLAQKIGKSLLLATASLSLLTSMAMADNAKPKSQKDIPEYISKKTDVAISNYPLFLLSEAVTKGAPSGKLLLEIGDIGHHGSLSPNDMKTIKDSRYVVWFGSALETNLAKPLATANNTIALFDLNAFNRRPFRDVKGQPMADTLDPHIWLDPNNAKAIVRALGAIYSRANPQYESVYKENVRLFQEQMDEAVEKVAGSTQSSRPYWAYHDAFSYIEPTLKLDMVGSLTTDHHLPPKASQILWLNKNRPKQEMCMVLQSDNNKNVLNKLTPVQHTVQSEDMGSAKDFITGWQKIANDIKTCVDG